MVLRGCAAVQASMPTCHVRYTAQEVEANTLMPGFVNLSFQHVQALNLAQTHQKHETTQAGRLMWTSFRRSPPRL
jgi:hypothetical protein